MGAGASNSRACSRAEKSRYSSQSIVEKLDFDKKVYPGHGNPTTIKHPTINASLISRHHYTNISLKGQQRHFITRLKKNAPNYTLYIVTTSRIHPPRHYPAI
jgi:hypothetical protein